MSMSFFDSDRVVPLSSGWATLVRQTGLLLASLVIFGLAPNFDFPLMTRLATLASGLKIMFIIRGGLGRHPTKETGRQLVEQLHHLSQTRSSDVLACIDTGLHWPAIAIGQHLTSGRLIVMDIYKPQLMPSRSLLRARKAAPAPLSDPRLIWYNSDLDLLPLPDSSVTAVFMVQVLSELVQQGDREALLAEIFRILEPDGRLLIAETADTRMNRLRSGLSGSQVQSLDYWSSMVAAAGFERRRTQTIDNTDIIIRVNKPSLYSGKQMRLDLGFG